MSDNMNKGFDQVAAFQKLWTDSFANMASVWSQFSPGSPPFHEMRKMRGGMLKVLAETRDEYMRTLNGALDLKRTARDGMNIEEPGLDTYKVGTVEAPCGGAVNMRTIKGTGRGDHRSRRRHRTCPGSGHGTPRGSRHGVGRFQ